MPETFADSFYTMVGGAVFPEENQQSAIAKICSIMLPGLGIMAGVPFLKAACDAAYETEPGCKIFQIATFVSFGLGTIWMFISVIDLIRRVPKEEVVKNYSKTYRYVQHGAVHVLSTVNTIIPAYISYQFNGSNPYYMFISVPVSYAFNVYAFYQLTDISNFRYIYYCVKTCATDSPSTQLMFNIERLSSQILNLPHAEGELLCGRLFVGESGEEFLANINNAVELLEVQRPIPLWAKIVRCGCQFAFLVFPIANIFVNARLSREAVELLTKNELLVYMLAGLMLTVGTTMDTIFALRTAGLIHDEVVRKLTKAQSPEYLSAHWPKLAMGLTATSLILGGLSASSRIQIAKKTVDNLFVVVSAGVNATIFECYAQRDLMGSVVASGVGFFNMRDAQLTRAVNKLRVVSSIVSTADQEQLNRTLSNEGLITNSM